MADRGKLKLDLKGSGIYLWDGPLTLYSLGTIAQPVDGYMRVKLKRRDSLQPIMEFAAQAHATYFWRGPLPIIIPVESQLEIHAAFYGEWPSIDEVIYGTLVHKDEAVKTVYLDTGNLVPTEICAECDALEGGGWND